MASVPHVPWVFGGYLPYKSETAKTANYTLTASDSGGLFTNTGASGAVTFTLPALAANLLYGFQVVADQTVTVASAAGSDMVVGNNASASSVVLNHTGKKIGQVVEVMSNLAGTKWYVRKMSADLTPGVVYTNTAASAAHTNTTDEALFDTTYTIPANTLKAGSLVKIRYQGIATATNSTDTLTIKLYIGGLSGTALLTGTATDVANNNIFAGEFELIVRTAGASGTMVGVGTHTDVPAASGTAAHDITEILASTTIDTTAAQVIGVGADWSVANAGNSARLDFLRVEIY